MVHPVNTLTSESGGTRVSPNGTNATFVRSNASDFENSQFSVDDVTKSVDLLKTAHGSIQADVERLGASNNELEGTNVQLKIVNDKMKATTATTKQLYEELLQRVAKLEQTKYLQK